MARGLLSLASAVFARIVARCVGLTRNARPAITPPIPSSSLQSTSRENAIPRMNKSEQRPAGAEAIRLICRWEGFRPEPYLCAAQVPTIGYGTTVYPDGSKVSMQDPEITEAQAKQFLKAHIAKNIEPTLTREVGDIVNQNQYDALVSFIYNVGMANFRKSTLLTHLKARDFRRAAEEFPRWTKAGGKVLAGLIARRKDERELFERDPWA